MKKTHKITFGIGIPLIIFIIGMGILLPVWISDENNNIRTFWKTTDPQDVDMRSDTLNAMIDYLESENHDIFSAIVIRKGFIVTEWYAPGYSSNSLFRVYSVTKSITSLLIGIAIDKGYISGVNETMLSFFPSREIQNLTPQKKNITLEHLLTMTAGFDWPEWEVSYNNLNNIYHVWQESNDYVQFVLDRPMESNPGQIFNYNTGISHLLGAILEKATNMSILSFANEYLYEPLQVTKFIWELDPQGIPMGGDGLYLRPRDMAKLGYLFLIGGNWEGIQIISEEWINSSVHNHVNISIYSDYGYQWWISKIYDSYRASGFGGQLIHVFPEEELVITFTGWDMIEGKSWDLLDSYILPSL